MSVSSSATAAIDPWIQILGALEKKINRHSYDTWLKPTRYSHMKDNIMFVRVPTQEFANIGDRYGDLIQEAIDNLGFDFQDVQFVATVEESPAAKTQVVHNGGLSAVTAQTGVPNKQSRFDWDSAAQLNARYTFDGFVIGSGNQFASAAAKAVAENPSKAYNPLFLYGGVGIGKTTLIHAGGSEIKMRVPDPSYCYLSSEHFS